MDGRSEPPTGAQLTIRCGRQRAVVTEVGAGLRSWCVDGVEQLDGFGVDEAAPDFRGKLLAPWPNRLRDGRYTFGGREHRTPISEPERSCALHGLVAWIAWRVVEHSARRVALSTVLHPQPGYPFTLRLGVDYALTPAGLAITLRAVNLGVEAAPFGVGFHPYLRPGRIDETRLGVPGSARVPLDARLLPVGPPVPVASTDQDFRRARPIGELALNACFTALQRDADGLARIHLAGPQRTLTVWMDAAFPYAMVYTADEVADPTRRRAGIAVEPMTCAPDGFNSGAGLRSLEPREAFVARWGMGNS